MRVDRIFPWLRQHEVEQTLVSVIRSAAILFCCLVVGHATPGRAQVCGDANGDGQSVNGPNDGSLFTQFLNALNTAPCFAGHCDWRLPTVVQDGGAPELETLIDPNAPGCGSSGPCIAQVFGPTIADYHWSAVTNPASPNLQWGVIFLNGTVDDFFKVDAFHVRAVRSVDH